MINMVQIELYKIFKKWRTYIGFIAIGVLVPIIQVAMLYEGEHSINFVTRNIRESFVFVGNLLNSYFISYIILNALAVHIPFLITLVAADLLAGEATAGTYRLLVPRPVSRMKIVTSKFLAGTIYTNFLILWLAVISLGLGFVIFGVGELIVLKSGTIIIFEKSDVLWRFFLAYGYASLGMTVVCSLAFLFSSLVENAIGPIISTMAVIIVFIIVSAINIELFQGIKPYLFTSHILKWREFFNDPVDTFKIIESTLILFGHAVLFFGLAAFVFRKKDILS
ncbi:MAG: ABC transporter permease subunit [Ignavibacteriaceae bacterium]|nr:ABC transporter permease subunit [Ignavibacteriaceae bacterium]